MKRKRTKLLLLGAFLLIGCDNPTINRTGGSAGYDYLSWLQTMKKVRVNYEGMTNLQSSIKQDTRDSGNMLTDWEPRGMEFRNTDSTYTLVWNDSEFSTKSCFVFRQIDPIFPLSNDCGEQTLIRGAFQIGTKSVSSLVCFFQNYQPGDDINSFVAQSGMLVSPSLEMETYGDDSVSFVMTQWHAGSISLAYQYDEQKYGTYHKQIQLEGYDTLGTQYPEVCRLTFYKQ